MKTHTVSAVTKITKVFPSSPRACDLAFCWLGVQEAAQDTAIRGEEQASPGAWRKPVRVQWGPAGQEQAGQDAVAGGACCEAGLLGQLDPQS